MSEIPEVFAIFEQKLAHVLSFNLRQKGQKKAIEELLVYFSGIVARASKAEARIAELEEKRRWIPVSERLPDNWESVLTIDISKSTRDMVTAFYNPETSLWSTHFSCDLWVTHWMPLPEPPIVYGKECEE